MMRGHNLNAEGASEKDHARRHPTNLRSDAPSATRRESGAAVPGGQGDIENRPKYRRQQARQARIASPQKLAVRIGAGHDEDEESEHPQELFARRDETRSALDRVAIPKFLEL